MLPPAVLSRSPSSWLSTLTNLAPVSKSTVSASILLDLLLHHLQLAHSLPPACTPRQAGFFLFHGRTLAQQCARLTPTEDGIPRPPGHPHNITKVLTNNQHPRRQLTSCPWTPRQLAHQMSHLLWPHPSHYQPHPRFRHVSTFSLPNIAKSTCLRIDSATSP